MLPTIICYYYFFISKFQTDISLSSWFIYFGPIQTYVYICKNDPTIDAEFLESNKLVVIRKNNGVYFVSLHDLSRNTLNERVKLEKLNLAMADSVSCSQEHCRFIAIKYSNIVIFFLVKFLQVHRSMGVGWDETSEASTAPTLFLDLKKGFVAY